MAVQTISTLKSWFETGDYPTQQQFWDWLDSYRHKSTGVPLEEVTALVVTLQAKADLINGKVPVSQLPDAVVSGDLAELIAAVEKLTPEDLVAGATTWSVPYDCLIEILLVKDASGIDFKAGTTVGGNELIETRVDGDSPLAINYPVTEGQTIYFTGVESDTTIKIYKR